MTLQLLMSCICDSRNYLISTAINQNNHTLLLNLFVNNEVQIQNLQQKIQTIIVCKQQLLYPKTVVFVTDIFVSQETSSQ